MTDINKLAEEYADNYWKVTRNEAEAKKEAKADFIAGYTAAKDKPVVQDWDAIFQNNTDCYADTTDESVVPAMTKERFLEVIKSIKL